MTTLSGPTAVSYGRWASIKGALKLERIGMKTRGGAIRPKIAAELGLKPRDSYEAFITAIQVKMDSLLTLKQLGEA